MGSGENKTYVQRSFLDLTSEQIVDVEYIPALAQYGWSGTFGWKKLLESKRILIISEAGAGKTFECRRQQQEMWERGEPAFLVELAEVAATSRFQDLLSDAEDIRFQAWFKSQSDVATFFLDSVDELKLTQRSFDSALKHLRKFIGGQLGRLRLVVTTRPIAVDLQLIERHFPVPQHIDMVANAESFADIAVRTTGTNSSEESDEAPAWRTVGLMPLSDEQIRAMAETQDVVDANALLHEIRARNAQDFARRPQDLVEICSDWKEYGRLRCHRDQIFTNISVKLKPRADGKEAVGLSPDRALEGASRLALAMMATRRLTIRLNVESNKGQDKEAAIDPGMLLHDWTPEERQTLLQRALFGFASYGRVRFHHRSVIEFLAAFRLERKLKEGMSIKEVKRLLFGETPQGIKVARPGMRPVVAWLAGWEPRIFSEVRHREPDVLLVHGDPESLALSQRIDALTSYVRTYGKGGWRGMHVPGLQVHRFASPALGQVILKLLSERIENHEVRELLIELAGAGNVTECRDVVYEAAVDSTLADGERIYAINALAALEDERLSALTRAMSTRSPLWPDQLVRRAVLLLMPRHISARQLCEILEHVEDADQASSEIGWHLPNEISSEPIESSYLQEFLTGLSTLVTRGVVWDRQEAQPSTKLPHLVPALAAVCLRLIRLGDWSDRTLSIAVLVNRLAVHDASSSRARRDLREYVAASDVHLRELLFWADDACVQGFHKSEDGWQRFVHSFGGLVQANLNQDGPWMHKILGDSQRPLAEREVMLNTIMRGAWDGDASGISRISGLRSSVADAPSLSAQIDAFLKPRPIDLAEMERSARYEARRKSEEDCRAARHAKWMAFWREISENPEAAFSRDRSKKTAWDLWNVMQAAGSESRASGWNRRFVEFNFGKETADRMRNAMRDAWRSYRPSLRSERPEGERGTTMNTWYFGLAAITAEAEDTNWATKLSTEEAELAARYAPLDLESFPTWLEDLAMAHPAAVEHTLVPELIHEVQEISLPRSFAMLLQHVSHAPSVIASLFVPRLRAWVNGWSGRLREAEDEPAMARKIEGVLRLLLEYDPMSVDYVCQIAKSGVANCQQGGFRQLWLTFLMRLDPEAGVEAFEAIFSADRVGSVDPAVQAVSDMFGARRGDFRVDLKRPGFTPEVLLRLLRLVYQHVRPSDDEVHEGSSTPSMRDEAEDGRNAVLSALLDAKGAAAWVAKLEMVNDPLFSHFRDRIALLAREKAAEELDESIMTEADAVSLDRFGSTAPKTRLDMFALLMDRLDDLDDFLLQEDSPRALWASTRDEVLIRRETARELNRAANHLYKVDQESVTIDEKETDIRLRAVSSDQQAIVELKIGENHTGPVLRGAIRNQLVRKYMAPENCRSGCLLVTVASDEKGWVHPDTSELLQVDGLRTMLQEEAVRVADEMAHSVSVAIKVLDLRPRLATEGLGAKRRKRSTH